MFTSNKPVRVIYSSCDVAIPDTFLTDAPSDAQPVTVKQIDFANSPLPEYAGKFAIVLDNVLSPYECAELISLAEQSAGQKSWQPALVNVGNGMEARIANYRDSERIIWDSATIVKRIWARCQNNQEAALLQKIGRCEDDEGGSWTFSRVNERLRFLKYGPGHFFSKHYDGQYTTPDEKETTFYTLHLYLSDAPEGSGGATSFWDKRGERRVDVEPRRGRVLIFQHEGLLHSGEPVVSGVKYTVRTDLLYRQ